MGANRECIYTRFARRINDFTAHELTKEDLYNEFVSCVELSTEEERNLRKKYENDMKKLREENASPLEKSPYNNWLKGLQLVTK